MSTRADRIAPPDDNHWPDPKESYLVVLVHIFSFFFAGLAALLMSRDLMAVVGATFDDMKKV